MTKAFDSVSKSPILLCWQRLGVPLNIAQWLVDLDEAGYTIVRTPYANEIVNASMASDPSPSTQNVGLAKETFITPPTGSQCSTFSSRCWSTTTSEHHFLLRHPDGSLYVARDICFADDLQSFGSTLESLQRAADLVSTYAMVFNLSIASHKLLAFHFRGLALPPSDPPYILVHAPGWIPQPVHLKSKGTF